MDYLAIGNNEPLPEGLPEELAAPLREARARAGWCDHGNRTGDCGECLRSSWTVSERWVVAIEGVQGSDGRGLVTNQTIWKDQVPVSRYGPNWSSELIGKLSQFERDTESGEITALYEGQPLRGVPSLEVMIIDQVGGMRSRWMVAEIRGAVDLEAPTMFGELIRRVDREDTMSENAPETETKVETTEVKKTTETSQPVQPDNASDD